MESTGYRMVSQLSEDITEEFKADTISAITDVFHDKNQEHEVTQYLTAVLPEYRGKGIGKWIKAKMLVDVVKDNPEIQYLQTVNQNVNAAMLGINNKMGFKKANETFVYKFDRTEIETLLNTW